MRRLSALVVVVLSAVLVAVLQSPASAQPSVPNGNVRVIVRAPEGVSANVVLTGIGGTSGSVKRVATKPQAGTSATVTLTMPTGGYVVTAPRFVANGVSYVGRASLPVIAAAPVVALPVEVTYTAEEGGRDLAATSIAQGSIGLSWTGPAGAQYVLRRAAGKVPPAFQTAGTAVPVKGTAATDQGLAPGTDYAYSLFSQVKGRWYGPLTVSAGTAPAPGSDRAAFVAAPGTLIATAQDVATAVPTGAGVRLTLTAQVQAPPIGSGVTLPISDALPGGYLGVVTAVSPDGRTVELAAGGLADAFDYYELDIDLGTPPLTVPSTQPNSLKKSQGSQVAPSGRAETAPDASPAPQSGVAAAPTQSPTAGLMAPAPTAKAAAAPSCSVSGNERIVFDPGVELGGHLRTKLDTKHFITDIPTGASIDMRLTTTVTGAVDVERSQKAECGFAIRRFRPLTTSPVPLSVLFEGGAKVSVNGKTKISNLGVAVTGGFQVSGTMDVKKGPSFTGGPVAEATPLTPSITTNETVGVRVGGALTVGPGIGTNDAGVIAGVKGEVYPLDASFGPKFPAEDPRHNSCLEAKAGLTLSASLTAKAWLKKWSYSKDITLDFLNNKTFGYGGSPWVLPSGCDKATGPGKPDSLYGPGVTKVEDSVVGDTQQWGHPDGFAPGQKTWVLSTGRITNAVGSPGDFASTNMGRPGDDELTALAGRQTYDGAAYTTTIVPTGSTLHVKYVFASEEYPEYVGSAYNDLMAVRVNGKNCATVPGTSDPVSINNVNAGKNSQFYVDNAAGAAGYSTSMDGLTVPLTCNVPVTPGQPVTVQIVVADTSDAVYDSAVALVDGGIWTD